MWKQVKMPNRHFLRSDIFTFVMVYSFYFLLVGSRRNEFNSLWGDKGGYVRSLLLARKVYHPEEKDDILSQYNSEFIVYNDSWRYHLISMTASRRQYQNKPQPSSLFPISFPKTISFIPCGTNTQKIKIIDHCKYNVRASKNAGRHTFWVAVDF